MESVGERSEDTPPPRPAGVHTSEKELPSYSKMIAALIDQVKAKVDEDKPENRYEAYVAEVQVHQDKILDLQRQLLDQLNELEIEESKKITSESYGTGFSTSHVAKAEPLPPAEPKKPAAKKQKVQAVEVLNPKALAALDDPTSGAEADVDEPPASSDEEDDEDIKPTALGKEFVKFKMGDYRGCLQFISQHPTVLAEKETDALLVMAFNAAIDDKQDFARLCVHQALLLQYCRSLGKDGVGLFFKRITTQGHPAQKVFFDDVQATYTRIKLRAHEIVKQRAQEEVDGSGGVEQIQLHAVDPGTAINIQVPPADSTDPDIVEARKVFDSFPPGLQRALESGSLDAVNVVLGKMSVEQAEEIVGQLGEVRCSLFSFHLHIFLVQ